MMWVRISGGETATVVRHKCTERRLGLVEVRVFWLAVAAIVLDGVIWSGLVLPDGCYRVLVRNEWLLLLSGPPFAVVYRAWGAYVFAFLGSATCLVQIWRALASRKTVVRSAWLVFFVASWLVFGLLAVTPWI